MHDGAPKAQILHYAAHIKKLELEDVVTPADVPREDLLAFLMFNAEYLVFGKAWFEERDDGTILIKLSKESDMERPASLRPAMLTDTFVRKSVALKRSMLRFHELLVCPGCTVPSFSKLDVQETASRHPMLREWLPSAADVATALVRVSKADALNPHQRHCRFGREESVDVVSAYPPAAAVAGPAAADVADAAVAVAAAPAVVALFFLAAVVPPAAAVDVEMLLVNHPVDGVDNVDAGDVGGHEFDDQGVGIPAEVGENRGDEQAESDGEGFEGDAESDNEGGAVVAVTDELVVAGEEAATIKVIQGLSCADKYVRQFIALYRLYLCVPDFIPLSPSDDDDERLDAGQYCTTLCDAYIVWNYKGNNITKQERDDGEALFKTSMKLVQKSIDSIMVSCQEKLIQAENHLGVLAERHWQKLVTLDMKTVEGRTARKKQLALVADVNLCTDEAAKVLKFERFKKDCGSDAGFCAFNAQWTRLALCESVSKFWEVAPTPWFSIGALPKVYPARKRDWATPENCARLQAQLRTLRKKFSDDANRLQQLMVVTKPAEDSLVGKENVGPVVGREQPVKTADSIQALLSAHLRHKDGSETRKHYFQCFRLHSSLRTWCGKIRNAVEAEGSDGPVVTATNYEMWSELSCEGETVDSKTLLARRRILSPPQATTLAAEQKKGSTRSMNMLKAAMARINA